MRMTNLPEPGQCKFTTIQRLDLRGNIPSWVSYMKLKDTLSTPTELNIAFDRDEEIDEVVHARLAHLMRHQDEQVYDAEEIALVQKQWAKVFKT